MAGPEAPSAPEALAELSAVMARLRDPATGCEWDKVQTFATIAPYTIEEAYEVDDAIRRGDMALLCDELGDLQLQVVYHARIAEEQGAFDLGDVISAIAAKMVRRHPHIFGDAAASPGGFGQIRSEVGGDGPAVPSGGAGAEEGIGEVESSPDAEAERDH